MVNRTHKLNFCPHVFATYLIKICVYSRATIMQTAVVDYSIGVALISVLNQEAICST